MPVVDYTIPIGPKYKETLPFAEERDDIKVGTWIWMVSNNNRYYPPYAGGRCIIEGHYQAFCVVNETNTHWHVTAYPENGRPSIDKVKKQDLKTAQGQMGASSFYTHNEMIDAVWMSYNRMGVEKALRKCRDEEALAKVLEAIDGCDVFDYEKYLKQEGRRCGNAMPLGEAIGKAIHDNMWHHMPHRSKIFIYRNIANAIGYEEPEREDLRLWQEDHEKKGW